MRFGTFVPQGWRHDLVGIEPERQWSVMRDLARHADDAGWESLWVYDHFHTVPQPTEEATHEAWTLMAGLGASTSRIRLGQMCTSMGYRNPAYLAKVAVTADHVSGGRIEMGIGGGWYEHEWRAYGYGFPAIGDRLRALEEGVEIMHQAFTTGSATLHGRYFDVDGAIVRPLPVQRGGIPIWVAGAGEKVTLRIAAKYADATNFSADPATFPHKLEVLEAHCRDLGRDPGTIRHSGNVDVIVADTEAEVDDVIDRIVDRLTPVLGAETAAGWFADHRARTGDAWGVGTVEQVAERFAERAAFGLDTALVYFPDVAHDTSSRDLFEARIRPELETA